MTASLRVTGGAPEPDADRVRAALDLLDAAEPADFASAELEALAGRLDRVLAELRTGDLTEAAALLAHIRSELSGLAPGDLEPRRGLGGLFDSRAARLKRFRARFNGVTRSLSESAGQVVERAGGVQRRDERLETLWNELREAIVGLDACRAAGMERCPAPALDADEVVTVDGAAALRGRLALVSAAREAALKTLPCIRAAQNADVAPLARLKGVPDIVEAWRADWSDALGLGGRKPKKVRPDRVRLTASREQLTGALEAADLAIATAKTRRAEIEARLEALRRTL